jgi:hypothetical protein
MVGSAGITPALAHANLLDINARGQPAREAKQKKGLDYSMDSNNLDSGGDTVSPNTSNLYIPQDTAGMGVLNEGNRFAKQDATLQKNFWVSSL